MSRKRPYRVLIRKFSIASFTVVVAVVVSALTNPAILHGQQGGYNGLWCVQNFSAVPCKAKVACPAGNPIGSWYCGNDAGSTGCIAGDPTDNCIAGTTDCGAQMDCYFDVPNGGACTRLIPWCGPEQP